MILKFSELPSARPPDTTREADCSSGRSLLGALRLTKRVWVGNVASVVTASTGAEPPPGAAANEAVRIVATSLTSGGDSTVTSALPAYMGRLNVWGPSTAIKSLNWPTPSRAATRGSKSFPKVLDGASTYS